LQLVADLFRLGEQLFSSSPLLYWKPTLSAPIVLFVASRKGSSAP
jgi:hypothetical protein